MKVESIFYKSLDEGVQCQLCSHFCVIPDGGFGFCNTQRNVGGRLFSCNFGVFSSVGVDPIEKKPLYHFLPGSFTLSLGGFSCNMSCLNCQNYMISQHSGENFDKVNLLPEEIVKIAVDNDCPSISWTYNEPTLYLQHILKTAKISHKQKIKNILITNGYMSKKALKTIIPHIDAFNIDLKSIKPEFYKTICNTKLQPILNNIKTIHKHKKHIEITNLLIPKHNTTTEEITQLTKFIKKELGKETPIHFSRFHPQYKMTNTPPTPIKKLHQAKEIAKKQGLKNIYLGNIPENQNSHCPTCGETLIKRNNYTTQNKLKENKCPKCKTTLNYTLK